MSVKVGIIGLPNVGKTTLFNALTRLKAPAANYPFTTVEPNVGVVPIPDERLGEVARVVGSATVTPATIELVDVAGLVKGAHRGEGLGNEFLAHLRPMDALFHVVRAFADPAVTRAGSVSPEDDITTIRAELAAKDAEIRARRERRKEPEERSTGEPALAEKPVLYVFNAGEDLRAPPEAAPFQPAVVVSAKIEAELAALAAEDRAVFLKAYGLDHPRTEDVVRALLDVTDLLTFFTANEKEARAWLLPRGATALTAAGLVHTDFARGFVRADVVSVSDLVAAGSSAAARARGLVREEGKDYAVQDGEVLLFKATA